MRKTVKKRQKTFINENPVEAIRDNLTSGVGSSFYNDLLKPATTRDLWEQLLGGSLTKKSTQLQAAGDLGEGENIDIKALEKQLATTEKKVQNIEPGINYHREIIKTSEKAATENTYVLERRIQEVIVELKKLASSSKELELTFRQVSIEETPVAPGKYHLNFFEWVLSVVRSARLRIDESKTWLTVLSSKKQRRQYWAMFKKHGTSFGLSSERVVATQTG